MNVGDTVITKKLGPPIMGTIVAIMTYKVYIVQFGPLPLYWSDVYPDYPDKPIVILELPSKTRVISYDEFVTLAKQKNPDATIPYKQYQELNKEYQHKSHPIDDLELL